MLLTLKAAKASALRNIAAVCTDSDEFAQLVNDATRELMDRGHWFGTVQKIQGCIRNNCITWPRFVGTVRAINFGTCTMPMFNGWYGFMPMETDDYRYCCGHMADRVAIDNGLSPVFNNVECNKGMYIRHYITAQKDKGKSVTIFGTDINGQELRHRATDGSNDWLPGVVLTTDIPFSSTSVRVRHVSRVLLDEMTNPNRLYQYDPDNDVLLDMAYYEAGETSPQYRQTKVNARLQPSGAGKNVVTALVDLEYIPVKYDSDMIQIGCIDALKLMMQAIKSSDAYDYQQSEAGIMRAVHRLNLELYKRYPLDQVPVQMNPWGTARPIRAGIGGIV